MRMPPLVPGLQSTSLISWTEILAIFSTLTLPLLVAAGNKPGTFEFNCKTLGCDSNAILDWIKAMCGAKGGYEINHVNLLKSGNQVSGVAAVCVCVNDGVKEASYGFSGPGSVPEGSASLRFNVPYALGCQSTS